VQSKAYLPSNPANQRHRIMLAVAALLGALALGVAVAYLRARTRAAVEDTDDLAGAAAAPFLGHIPLVGENGGASTALQAECVRMVRTALLQRLRTTRGGVIQITSAGPGAGKTTLSVLLADSLAQCGQKVLLVDADVRKPLVHEHCAIPAEPGLLGLLRSDSADETAIHSDPNRRYCVLPAGRSGALADGELLANGVLAKRLRNWRDRFDIVLFDSPPILPSADARILAGHMDGMLLVVRQSHCRRNDITDALAHVQMAGTPLLGLVFVGQMRASRYGYYGHYGPYAADKPPGSETQEAAAP